LDELVALIAAIQRRPVIVGLTGPVSVGKTTIANLLRDELAPLETAVVSTDGFLLSNAELADRGISMRKGFPESFDTEALSRFVAAARAGETPLRVPVYDHLSYDVVPDRYLEVAIGDVLIVEGVNALLPAHVDAYDVTIYVEAPDDAVFGWFLERLAALFIEARDDPTSFYAVYAEWPREQVDAFARSAWDGINAVNLEEHIRPARARAQVVIEKAPDHAIRRVIIAP
jgi:type I pantothenate kinase